MFDFNCNVAQGWGVYQINQDKEYEIAKYASTINIASGIWAGDPVTIAKAMKYAQDRNLAISALVAYPDVQGFGRRKMQFDDDELESIVVYQIGALKAFASSYSLEIENVRCHGALKDDLNNDEKIATVVTKAVKRINPWFNLFAQNQNTKDLIQSCGLKSALEVDFASDNSIDDLIETEKQAGFKIDTVHFKTLDDIKKAYETVKPSPVNYNRVLEQI